MAKRRQKGMPNACRCGESSLIKTSGTSKNPGRLFHCCPKGSENDNYRLFKWTDESMVEELFFMKETMKNLEMKTRTCEDMVNCIEKDIKDLKMVGRGYEKEMETMKAEVRLLKCMIVCGVVVFAGYFRFCA
ncbi:hypothetical protein EUTSA_v10011039mg [Eutrema salsugineum]|uniref:GRF-type domain-containing protein n=1 Tax=Eutrema salsugineum TaxID=72664 RepID=V4L554_EUTSA|nr:hypothetical protein EUTSA_v10011039mg [Eutrema salsugineum]